MGSKLRIRNTKYILLYNIIVNIGEYIIVIQTFYIPINEWMVERFCKEFATFDIQISLFFSTFDIDWVWLCEIKLPCRGLHLEVRMSLCTRFYRRLIFFFGVFNCKAMLFHFYLMFNINHFGEQKIVRKLFASSGKSSADISKSWDSIDFLIAISQKNWYPNAPFQLLFSINL